MSGRTLFSFFEHRELVWAMAVRELTASTKGAMLGAGWLALRPLLQGLAYALVVTLLLGRQRAGGLDYVLYVLAGTLPWAVLGRSLEEAPALLRSRMDLVKQVIYPIETLPATGLLVNALGAAGTLLLVVGLGAALGQLRWTWLLLPLPALLLAALVLGASWGLMIVGVVVRDLREVVSLGLSLMVFATPVALREDLVGPTAWRAIAWNPLTHVVVCFRDVLQAEVHPWSWAIFAGMALTAFLTGGWVICRAKQHINEYL